MSHTVPARSVRETVAFNGNLGDSDDATHNEGTAAFFGAIEREVARERPVKGTAWNSIPEVKILVIGNKEEPVAGDVFQRQIIISGYDAQDKPIISGYGSWLYVGEVRTPEGRAAFKESERKTGVIRVRLGRPGRVTQAGQLVNPAGLKLYNLDGTDFMDPASGEPSVDAWGVPVLDESGNPVLVP